jgi:hypothetical protein
VFRSKAAWFVDELRDDLAEQSDAPVWNTVRLVCEAALVFTIILRGAVQVCVYCAADAEPDGVSYRYVGRQVAGLSDAQAHRARLLTCALGLAWWVAGPVVFVGLPPAVALVLGVNGAALVVDPVSPLWLPAAEE